jgi:hypothetical protein
MNEQNDSKSAQGNTDLWLVVLALGSVAGLIEVVAGGLLRDLKFPFTSGLLTGLGFAIIGIGFAIFKKPILGIIIGLVAILCKLLIVPIMHVSVMCSANSCLAVLLEYGALSGIAATMGSKMQGKVYRRILAGGSAALISSIAFYFIGMRLAPCNYLMTFREAGVFSFVSKEGSSWIISSVILFPLGWLVGQRMSDKMVLQLMLKPRLIHGGAALIVILCWTISAIGISQGL